MQSDSDIDAEDYIIQDTIKIRGTHVITVEDPDMISVSSVTRLSDQRNDIRELHDYAGRFCVVGLRGDVGELQADIDSGKYIDVG